MTTHHDPDRLAAASVAAARLAGCNCSPDLDLSEEAPGIYRATVRHDPWCQLLRRRSAPWN